MIVSKNHRIKVKNLNETKEKFNSHIIVQTEGCEQIYIDIGSETKAFSIKKEEEYENCLLKLVENNEETTFNLQTAKELYNITDKNIEISSATEKILINAGQKLSLPLS